MELKFLKIQIQLIIIYLIFFMIDSFKKINISYIEEFNKNGYFKVKDASSNLVELINDRIIRPQEKNINPNSKNTGFMFQKKSEKKLLNKYLEITMMY